MASVVHHQINITSAGEYVNRADGSDREWAGNCRPTADNLRLAADGLQCAVYDVRFTDNGSRFALMAERLQCAGPAGLSIVLRFYVPTLTQVRRSSGPSALSSCAQEPRCRLGQMPF